MDDYGLHGVAGPATDEKTPGETIRVPFHWAERLDGAAITATQYEFPDGLTGVDTEEDGTFRAAIMSSGDAGRTYRVICTVTTNDGRTLQQTRRVAVREG